MKRLATYTIYNKNLAFFTYIATQLNKFTELRHGVLQIDYIYKTQLIRQSYTLLPCLYDGKIHESIIFVDFS